MGPTCTTIIDLMLLEVFKEKVLHFKNISYKRPDLGLRNIQESTQKIGVIACY